MDTAIDAWFVSDEEECASAVDWSQFSTGGRDCNVRVWPMAQVGSKWKWMPENTHCALVNKRNKGTWTETITTCIQKVFLPLQKHKQHVITYSCILVRRNWIWLSLLRPELSITITSSESALVDERWTGNFHTPPEPLLLTFNSAVQLRMWSTHKMC